MSPKGKTILETKQLQPKERTAAIAQRKRFEELPFPFLYRLKETTARAGFPIKKGLFFVAALYGAYRVGGLCADRLSGYEAEIQTTPAHAKILLLSERNMHLVGPAIALYRLTSKSSPELIIKNKNSVDAGVDGVFWTFEQFADYKKKLFGSSEQLKNLYEKLFGVSQASAELMKDRVSGVLNLLVPSVDYNPRAAFEKLSVMANPNKKYKHISDNGKELRWLYRWAWFYGRTDKTCDCDPLLLGADFSFDDIPKKLYSEVEAIIQENMQVFKIEPTAFKSVSNEAKFSKRTVVFRDPRNAASAELLRLFRLYQGFLDDKSVTVWLENLYHQQMPYWDVLYNTSTGCGVRSPFMFNGQTITNIKQESTFLDHFVIAARASMCYPYPYFGFSVFSVTREDRTGFAASDDSPERPAGTRRPHSSYAKPDLEPDLTYRTDAACKVCDIDGFSAYDKQALYDDNDRSTYVGKIIRIKPDGEIIFEGDMFTAISTHVMGATDDIYILQTTKLSAAQREDLQKLKKIKVDSGKFFHPGRVERYQPSLKKRENPGMWVSLRAVAAATQCEFEMCTDLADGSFEYAVHLRCKTAADAKKVKSYLAQS